jgi:GDP-4-dehydro-6-deoxy-D-mannose reductase
MNKVLVTGANGFVGKHLINGLVKNNLQVLAIGGQIGDMEGFDTSVDHKVMDLLNPLALREIDFSKIDFVIHLAGLAAVGPSFQDPMGYINTNIGIEVNLLETCLKQGCAPRFLIISSGSLYGANAELPLTEDSEIIPSSPYAVSKLGQEQMAQYYRTRNIDCIIARPFNHVGPGQGEGFILPDLAKQIVEFEKGIKDKIEVGNLEAKRDYTDVRDIIRAYISLVEKGASGEVYNICSGQAYSGSELLEKLIRLAKINPNIVQDSNKMRPTDNPIVYGSHAKLTKDTGWNPKINIDQTISDVLDYWRTRV